MKVDIALRFGPADDIAASRVVALLLGFKPWPASSAQQEREGYVTLNAELTPGEVEAMFAALLAHRAG